MKKIIISLLYLIITFGLIGVGTYGAFAASDADNNSINSIPLKLSVNGKNIVNSAYVFENIKPGDSSGCDSSQNLSTDMSWTVKNTGQLDGMLKINIENIEDKVSPLSTQIKPQLRVNGITVRESSNLNSLLVYERDLQAGEEVIIDMACQFYESAGNEYQGASTTFDVKFYITAPPAEDAVPGTVIPAESLTLPPPLLEVASITEPFIEVLAFTGLKPITYIAGLILIIAGILLFIITCIKKTILN